ncbi:MAG: hypothetical protein QW326_04175 [Fervidicoccaceae archaeon]
MLTWDCSVLLMEKRELEFLSKGTDSAIFLFQDDLVLKISRTDRMLRADREANILRLISWKSKKRIAPRAFANTRYCILMERISGNIVKEIVDKDEPKLLSRKLINLIEAAVELDNIGIAHGELSRVGEHVIFVEETPIFIDFGRASVSRSASNLTQVLSQLFFSKNIISSTLKEKLGLSEKDIGELLEIAKSYKELRKLNKPDEKILEKISHILSK